MYQIKYISTLFCLFAICGQSLATSDSKLWLKAGAEGKLFNKKYLYTIDGNVRFFENKEANVDRDSIRSGLGYAYSNKTTLWLGVYYGYSDKEISPNSEQRIWQQLSTTLVQNQKFKLIAKTRLEERFRYPGNGMALRLRQKIEIQQPLFNQYFDLVCFEELFVNLTTPQWEPSFFDQNRIFIGVEHPFSKKTSVLIGYLNRYQPNATINQILYVSYKISG